MTTRKHFKALVRERMRHTGERYSVARAHVVGEAPGDAWELRGGLHAETAAYANVLANTGVLAPHTGEPLTEAMVLGVGGGLGAGYILWEFGEHDARVLVLGHRRLWQYPARWAAETAERLGLHADVHETGGTKAAAQRLDSVLDRGLPAIVWVDPYQLGHRHLPAWLDGHGGGPVVVYGRDGGDVLIDDRSSGRLAVPAHRLAAARARVGSYKHRLIEIDPELVEIDADRLRAAVEEGLRLQVEHLSSRSDSFSLPAWAKWARMLTGRGAKAWPQVFADGRGLASATASIYTAAGRGAHLRGLYAAFLDEAATLLGRDLQSAAAAWREAAAAWERVVDVALPAGSELRAAIDAAIAHGGGERLDRERWALQEHLDASYAVPFEALAEAVSAMHAAETAALATQV